MQALADVGVRGSLERPSETSWKLAFTGRVLWMDAHHFYPEDPDPAAPVCALNRSQVRALVALVAGEQIDGLDSAVAALTASLG